MGQRVNTFERALVELTGTGLLVFTSVAGLVALGVAAGWALEKRHERNPS